MKGDLTVQPSDLQRKLMDPDSGFDLAHFTQLNREYTEAVDAPEFSHDQKAAISSYAGAGYQWLNRYLRNNEHENLSAEHSKLTVSTGSPATWQKMADLLHEALDKSRTKRDLVVFRGVRKGAVPDLKVGDEITDHGFISTSMDPSEAEGFSGNGGGTVFQISLPRGTNALPGSENEAEFLLRPGSTMRVVGVEGRFTKVVLV